MKWNLLPVLNCDGKRMQIDTEVAVTARKGDRFRILKPVRLKGEVVNVSGLLEFHAACTAEVGAVCDRCAEPYTMQLDFTVDERMKKADPYQETDGDSDIRILKNDVLDLDVVVYEALYLALPGKMLCREDCKGLCPMCGQNLNLGSCHCDTEETDPRFDVLNQLL